MWKGLGERRLPAPTIIILLERLLADARGRRGGHGVKGHLSNVQLYKAFSPPCPSLVPQFWSWLLERGLSKEVSLPAEKNGEGHGKWGGTLLLSDWERESQKAKDRFLVLLLWNCYDY